VKVTRERRLVVSAAEHGTRMWCEYYPRVRPF